MIPFESYDRLDSTPNVPEETSYSRLQRLGNLDPAQISKSLYAAGHKSKSKRPSFAPIIVILLSVIVYMVPIFPMNPTAHSCLAILTCGALSWATEIIPSYATGYLVLGLSIWLGIGYDSSTGTKIPSGDMAVDLAAKFMDPIILVFLGSLTISAALTKLEITDRVSAFLLRKISPKPKIVLLTLMAINFVIASFLSNAASTTLTLTFSLPIIRSLDPDDPFILSLLFGLAWSGNAGGVVTPISSPQNIIAMKLLSDEPGPSVSFFKWFGFGFVIGLLNLVFFYLFLILRFKPKEQMIDLGEQKEFSRWGWQHTFTTGITIVTIALWALNDTLKSILGHVGITSVIPVVAFFGCGILDGNDFGSLRWSTLVLMGGGLALGESMRISGLLDIISSAFGSVLSKVPKFAAVVIICLVLIVLSSVVNHTSAAAIIFPVVEGIGEDLGIPHTILLISCLTVGLAGLFHISSFPNALVSGVQRHSRIDASRLSSESFLSGKQFFLYGWPMAIVSVIIVSCAGYGIMVGMKID